MERERVAGKAAGDERLFIPEDSSDATGGERGHGAAKPHGVPCKPLELRMV
jgi:hypothetical protein